MKILTNLTLAKKTTFLAILGLVVGISVFGFLGIQSVNQATDSMLQDRMTTTQIVADYLDDFFKTALAEFKYAIQIIEDDVMENNNQQMNEVFEETFNRISIDIQSSYLLDENMHIIGDIQDSSELLGEDMSFYHDISQSGDENNATISNLVLDPMRNTPVILLANPIKLNQGRDSGTVVVAIDFSHSSIGGFIQSLQIGETGYVEIIDQNGVVITRTDPGPELSPFEKSDHSERFAALIAAGEPTRGLCHTCHEPVQKVEREDVLAFVPITQANWGVVIRQSEEEALAPVRELRRDLMIYGISLAVIALLLVTITTRNVVGRLRLLTNSARKVAGGDFTSPVVVSQSDEVGILANSLEDMRIKLKASYSELEQLNEEVQKKDAIRGELLKDMFSIQEEERKRIARELHDETSQVLVSLNANFEAVIGMLPDNIDKAKKILRKAQATSTGILDEIHKLIYKLRPSLLDDMGLVAVVRWLTENNLEVNGINVKLKISGRQKRLPSQIEETLFRVINEAVNNIVRHSEAKNTQICLKFSKNSICAQIIDDGLGFDVDEAISSKDRPRGLGLLGMKERVELMNGTLDISSDDKGTEITIEIPLEKEVLNEQDKNPVG